MSLNHELLLEMLGNTIARWENEGITPQMVRADEEKLLLLEMSMRVLRDQVLILEIPKNIKNFYTKVYMRDVWS